MVVMELMMIMNKIGQSRRRVMSKVVDAVHVTWVNLRLGLRNHECRFKIQNSTVAIPPTRPFGSAA